MQKIDFVIPLQAINNQDESSVGNKALSLARMSHIGLVVPTGFCITGSAYREHLECSNVIIQLKTALTKLEHAESNQKSKILLNIRQAIVEIPLSEVLIEQIKKNYEELAANRIAVRSSATAEDLPGHSFAGQYDTYLDITSLEDCIDAIRKCWASLWTERAYEYRRKNGFDHLKVNMAVIVQSLIEADTSGVIFTTDPLNSRSDRIIIEACSGLGEALVSGKVTPDRFAIDKKKCRIISKNLTSEPSILDSQVKKLAKLAKKIETKFGCPQDIEWAIYKNRIYFLQSRPITASPPKKSWEDRQIWCSIPAREVMPDVVTPVTLSTFEIFGEGLFDPLFRVLCIDRGDHPIYAPVAGRMYFNANFWTAVIRSLPGIRNYDFKRLSGISHKGLQALVERIQNAPDEDLPDIKFSRLRFFLKLPLIIIGVLSNTSKKGQRILDDINTRSEKWSRLDAASLSTERILQYHQDIIIDLHEVLSHFLYLLGIFVSFPILYIVCTKWFSQQGRWASRLLAGLGDMDDAVAGLDLWRLAVAADEKPEVKALMLSNDQWHAIEGKLSQSDSGREFLKSWSEFMCRHGHHCRAELELYNQRWSETPDYILKLVRSYICQIGKTDPIQNYNKLRDERKQLEQQCRKRLKNPIKRVIFNSLLVRAQAGSVFRENVKSEVIKLIVAMRKILLDLSKRLTDRDVLKNQDDIFFLRLEEIEPVVQGKADFDIHQVLATRRTEYEKNKSITPPDVVFGRFDPAQYVPEKIETKAQVLNGLAVSPGVATGKARVILRADTDEQVLAGEILVAPFTDPGWTPYFVTAAAIVMDQGGILSHGSIVAREFGLPAVVNVGQATKIIKTGQTIEVDGNSGVVRILQ